MASTVVDLSRFCTKCLECLCIDYLVVVTDEESANVRINEPDNFTDSGWFSLEKLPTPRHSVLTDDYFLRLNSYFNKLVTATA